MYLPDWNNSNSNRKFPFSDNASLTLTNGYILPNDFLIDFFAFVPQGQNDTFYFKSLVVHAKTVGLVLSDGITDYGEIWLKGGSHISQEFELLNYSVTGVALPGNGFSKVYGHLTQGIYPFIEGGGLLAASAYSSVNTKVVTSIGIADNYIALTGDVKLLPDESVQLSVDGSTIRVDAVPDIDCDSFFTSGDMHPIKTINNLYPCTEDGNMYLTGEGVIRVETGTGSYAGESGNAIIVGSMLNTELLCPKPFSKSLRGDDGPNGPRGGPGGKGSCAQCYCVNIAIRSNQNPVTQYAQANAPVQPNIPNPNAPVSIGTISYMHPTQVGTGVATTIVIKGSKLKTALATLTHAVVMNLQGTNIIKSYAVSDLTDNSAKFKIGSGDFGTEGAQYCVVFRAIYKGKTYYYLECLSLCVISGYGKPYTGYSFFITNLETSIGYGRDRLQYLVVEDKDEEDYSGIQHYDMREFPQLPSSALVGGYYYHETIGDKSEGETLKAWITISSIGDMSKRNPYYWNGSAWSLKNTNWISGYSPWANGKSYGMIDQRRLRPDLSGGGEVGNLTFESRDNPMYPGVVSAESLWLIVQTWNKSTNSWESLAEHNLGKQIASNAGEVKVSSFLYNNPDFWAVGVYNPSPTPTGQPPTKDGISAIYSHEGVIRFDGATDHLLWALHNPDPTFPSEIKLEQIWFNGSTIEAVLWYTYREVTGPSTYDYWSGFVYVSINMTAITPILAIEAKEITNPVYWWNNLESYKIHPNRSGIGTVIVNENQRWIVATPAKNDSAYGNSTVIIKYPAFTTGIPITGMFSNNIGRLSEYDPNKKFFLFHNSAPGGTYISIPVIFDVVNEVFLTDEKNDTLRWFRSTESMLTFCPEVGYLVETGSPFVADSTYNLTYNQPVSGNPNNPVRFKKAGISSTLLFDNIMRDNRIGPLVPGSVLMFGSPDKDIQNCWVLTGTTTTGPVIPFQRIRGGWHQFPFPEAVEIGSNDNQGSCLIGPDHNLKGEISVLYLKNISGAVNNKDKMFIKFDYNTLSKIWKKVYSHPLPHDPTPWTTYPSRINNYKQTSPEAWCAFGSYRNVLNGTIVLVMCSHLGTVELKAVNDMPNKIALRPYGSLSTWELRACWLSGTTPMFFLWYNYYELITGNRYTGCAYITQTGDGDDQYTVTTSEMPGLVHLGHPNVQDIESNGKTWIVGGLAPLDINYVAYPNTPEAIIDSTNLLNGIIIPGAKATGNATYRPILTKSTKYLIPWVTQTTPGTNLSVFDASTQTFITDARVSNLSVFNSSFGRWIPSAP